VSIVERLGKFSKILKPGLHLVIPYIEKIQAKHILKEQSFHVYANNCVTKDNVFVNLDGILYYKIVDPYKVTYGSEDPI
jgi:regulator of protease activity HflC (stomatin/prohibitin superfamily)